jgi:hypothetical protein
MPIQRGGNYRSSWKPVTTREGTSGGRQSSLGDLNVPNYREFRTRHRRRVLCSGRKTRRTRNQMMAETILVGLLGLVIALGAQAALTAAPKPRTAPTVIPTVPKHSENPCLVRLC